MKTRIPGSWRTACTLARATPGVVALWSAVRAMVPAASVSLLVAVWADAAAGWAARRARWEQGPYAPHLDELVDLLDFVAAPAALAIAVAHEPVALPFAGTFVLCGIFRLARFSVEGLVDGRYRGMPVTYNGYVFALVGGVSLLAGPGRTAFPLATGALAVSSFLMVWGRIRIPEL